MTIRECQFQDREDGSGLRPLSLQLARHEATTLSTGYYNFHRTDSSRFTGSTHLLRTIPPRTLPSLTHQLKYFDD